MTKEESIRQLKVIRWILHRLYNDMYDDAIDYAIESLSKKTIKPDRDDDEDGWL